MYLEAPAARILGPCPAKPTRINTDVSEQILRALYGNPLPQKVNFVLAVDDTVTWCFLCCGPAGLVGAILCEGIDINQLEEFRHFGIVPPIITIISSDLAGFRRYRSCRDAWISSSSGSSSAWATCGHSTFFFEARHWACPTWQQARFIPETGLSKPWLMDYIAHCIYTWSLICTVLYSIILLCLYFGKMMLNLWNWGVTIGRLILRQTQPTLTTLATSENVAFFGVRWLYFEVEQNDKLFADKSLQCRPMLSNKKPVWTPATISYDTSARTDLLFFTLWVPGFGEASCSIAAGLVLARQIGKACTVNHQLAQLTLWNLFATNMSIMSHELNGGEGAVCTIAGRAVHLGIHRYHRSRHAENISVL